MASTQRPVRNRNQPSRNKDNIELNLQLIQKLEANRVSFFMMQGNKSNNTGSTNYAQLLSSLINSVNQRYRTSLSKAIQQKKNESTAKMKTLENSQAVQWAPNKQKKKYNTSTTLKATSKTPEPSPLQQQRKKQKNIEAIKNTRISKPNLSNQIPVKPNQSKQSKKVVVLSPPPTTSTKKFQTKRPFKRASYHIGIAYRIYIAQMQQLYPHIADTTLYDPTLPARRLRGER